MEGIKRGLTAWGATQKKKVEKAFLGGSLEIG